jgi:hypothetical protein
VKSALFRAGDGLCGSYPGKPVRTIVGSEEARSRAGLRPPPKLPVHISRRQLSLRLSDADMQEKELNRSIEQARTRRKAWAQAAVSSQHCANACSDATRGAAGPNRRVVGRAFGYGRVCNCAYRKSPFSGFHQCNIVTLRSKLATIAIRQGQAHFAIWLKFTGLIPLRIALSHCNHGNRPNILRRLVHSHQPQSFLLIPFQPSKKGGPVPPDGVVFAAWPVRLLPRSVRLTK